MVNWQLHKHDVQEPQNRMPLDLQIAPDRGIVIMTECFFGNLEPKTLLPSVAIHSLGWNP